MNDRFHIYQMRHLFKGDDPIGKYDVQTHTLRLNDAFGGLRDEAKAWFMRTQGIPVSVLVGDEVVKAAAPLMEFPAEIRALMTPHQGHHTPAAVDYARKNFPREEFDRRYQGSVPFDIAPSAPSAPAPPEMTDQSAPLNTLGLPEGSPANKKELAAALKERGIEFDGRAKTDDLVKLYMEAITPRPVSNLTELEKQTDEEEEGED